MNNLTKQFTTLLQCTNKNLKKQIALDISNNMLEYQDYIPYILKNCYKLIVSMNSDDRTAGCIIVRGIRKEYIDVRYKLESNERNITNTKIILDNDKNIGLCQNLTNQDKHSDRCNDHCVDKKMDDIECNDTYIKVLDKTLFLGATGKEYNTEILSITDIKKQVSKHAGIDDRFVKVELVNESDFSKREILAMRRREKLKKKTTAQEEEMVTEKSIENVYDFFKYLYDDLEHKEWHRRDGSFAAFVEILSEIEEEVVDKEEETLYENDNENLNITKDISKVIVEDNKHENEKVDIKNKKQKSGNAKCLNITNDTNYDNSIEDNDTSNASTKTDTYYKNPNTIIFYVPQNIIQKSFQVLYSDKLVDFVCDQISMPVREKVAKLIQILYKQNENKILDTLVALMKSSDWQIQCGSVFTIHKILERYKIEKKHQNIILEILSNLLLVKDEDIKNFCADVLCYLPIQNHKAVLKNCWKSIEDANEIAIGKKNILRLITKIYHEKMKIPNEDANKYNANDNNSMNEHNHTELAYKINLQKLIYCFRSSLFDVKLSVLEMAESVYKFLNENEKLYILRCVIENILLEENSELRMKSAGLYKTILSDNINYSNTIKHYLNVIGKNLEDEYNTDDFIWKGEELMFSKSGIKLLGRNEVMNGRVLFVREIYNIMQKNKDNENFVFMHNVLESNCDCIDNGIKTKNIYKIVFSCTLQNNFNFDDFDISSFFTPTIYSEIRKKENNKAYNSIYPSFSNFYIDFLRLKVFVCGLQIDDIKKLYENEENEEFLELISKIILNCNKYKNNEIEHAVYEVIVQDRSIKTNEVDVIAKIPNKKEFDFDVNTFFNAKIEKKCYASVFYKNYNIKKNVKFFEFVKKDEKRIKFFREVLKYFDTQFLMEHDFIFHEAVQACMEKENVDSFCFDIIKFYIKLQSYEEFVVKVLVKNMKIKFMKEVIENIKPSFYFLFPKRLLRKINNEKGDDSALASHCFSYIVPYLTLKSINKNISNDLKNEIKNRRNEIKELFDIKKEYKIECESSVKLRDYQKKGLAWMSFMKEIGVNGVLADDMGLGKTIMVLSFLSNEMHKMKLEKNINCSKGIDSDIEYDGINNKCSYKIVNHNNFNGSDDSLPVLILSPSSLTGHWEDEIKKKYKNLNASVYTKKEKKMDEICIVSFDLYRNEYTNFINTNYFYIIIDEGHVLKNRDTILYSRVMLLKSSHKLILTGTPIHNSVEDVFSLFNFLMPNYLGSEKEFVNFYVKPINQARESKATERDIEKSEKKMKELHKKILPFIMRRLKSDVLKDLPPKIVTDIIIEMDEEERSAYERIESFGKSNEIKDISDTIKNTIDDQNTVTTNQKPLANGYKDLGKSGFKKMSELLKICSHKQYIQNQIQDFDTVKKCKRSSKSISTGNEMHSSKVKALIDIINLCGGENMKNKILVFCQYKTTIDFVLKDLKSMSYIKYQRIDGSVKSELRNKIAQDFNTGDYHLMFLTTQVGGLGLNLTGADTVIMYEHDWNPFNDLQAMDRAHRIGQKRMVNVYRLITKNTIEERVMNLQNFKVHVAGSIVTQQNTEAGSMEIGDVFERFESKQ